MQTLKRNKKIACLLTPIALATAQLIMSQAYANEVELKPVVVQGIIPERLESVPGSFTVIDREELDTRQPFSIREALNTVPGLHIVGEDSLSNNLNIGMRGMDPRRTSRTLLMEDGMPLFFAPYADPSAHYSTPLNRIDRIEVVRGSGQVLYGPQTIGGMINFVTRPVPRNGVEGMVDLSAGNNGYQNYYASVGSGDERGGFMVDALNKKSDGVRSNHDSDIKEYTIKGQLNFSKNSNLVAKISRFEEFSHYSETNLSSAEYAADPFQAPTGRNDRFDQERTTYHLVHNWQLNQDVKLTTQAYRAKSDRASFRQINGPGEGIERCGVEENDENVPQPVATTDPNTCGGRWRPRNYDYSGIETRVDANHQLGGVKSLLVAGLRYHYEDILRRQYRSDEPSSQNMSWMIQNGTFRERLDIQTKALAAYAQNTFFIDKFTVTPGLRVESYEIKSDLSRAEGEDVNNPESKVTNRRTELLPALGATWQLASKTTLFAGVHKGMSLPRPDRDVAVLEDENTGEVTGTLAKVNPEHSINYEFGIRSQPARGFEYSATAFHTDYKDIITHVGDGIYRNAGRAAMSGFEVAGRKDFGEFFSKSDNIYVTLAYTNLIQAKYKSNITSGELEYVDGEYELDEGYIAQTGARMRYAPKHLLSSSIGYEHPLGIHLRLGIDYVSSQYSTGDGAVEENATGTQGIIPAYTLLNASVSYKPKGSKVSYYLNGSNLTDKRYLVSRVDGKLAGRGLQVVGGVKVSF